MTKQKKETNDLTPAITDGLTKQEFIGYSLDDKNYSYLLFDSFLDDNPQLEVGSKYYEGVFENENASKYTPIIKAENLMEVLAEKEDLNYDEIENKILDLDEDDQESFQKEFEKLIDKYFTTEVKAFISKQKKTITQNDIDRANGK